MGKLLAVVTSLILLAGCAAQKHENLAYSQDAVEITLPEFGDVKPEQLSPVSYATFLVHRDTPIVPRFGFRRCGVGQMTENPHRISFQIVGATERFVPLTGEIKERLFHVQMSPIDR